MPKTIKDNQKKTPKASTATSTTTQAAPLPQTPPTTAQDPAPAAPSHTPAQSAPVASNPAPAATNPAPSTNPAPTQQPTPTATGTQTLGSAKTKPAPKASPVAPVSCAIATNSVPDGPGHGYKYYDFEAQGFFITSDLWKAKQLGHGVYDILWVWYKDGHIDHIMTGEELAKYCPW